MKRLFVALAFAGSLSALAAPEKLMSVRVADTAGVISAISKFGEFVGNPMLVLPLAAGVTGNPAAKFFGPGREGAALQLNVYADPGKCATVEALAGDMTYALLYPVAKGKAGFLADHPGATEKDGVISVPEQKDAFVVFSADDAWAAMSDDAARARAALGDVDQARATLAGDLGRAEITPAGMGVLSSLLETALREMADKGNAAQIDEIVATLRQIKETSAALRVDDAGITLRGATRALPGTDLAGLKPAPLAPDAALAFAGKDAVYAAAWTESLGQTDLDACWEKIAGFVTRLGFDLGWAAYTKQGKARTLTFDFDGCVKYFATAGKAKLEALDPEAVAKEMEKLEADCGARAQKKSEGALALALKGADTKSTPAARFARLAPEAAAKKPYSVAVGSIYSALRALAPKVVALLPEEDRTAVQPLVQTLPPDGPGGFALYGWREGDAHRCVLRVSPDEIKGLGTGFNVVAGYMMMQEMKAIKTGADADED